jgi:hypothetical protein
MTSKELSSLRSQLIGMMECWNIGMLGLEDWGNGVLGCWGNGKKVFFLSESIDK